ncbi:XRE family transcriptional regulator, partial [bacterium]
MERDHIGARIHSGRLSRGISQIELAREAGVHRTVVARAEAGGECRDASLKKIARALGVTLTWLNRPFLGDEPYR